MRRIYKYGIRVYIQYLRDEATFCLAFVSLLTLAKILICTRVHSLLINDEVSPCLFYLKNLKPLSCFDKFFNRIE